MQLNIGKSSHLDKSFQAMQTNTTKTFKAIPMIHPLTSAEKSDAHIFFQNYVKYGIVKLAI
jgi:hypothetical protein